MGLELLLWDHLKPAARSAALGATGWRPDMKRVTNAGESA